jgi:hypothetical protein
VNLRHLTVALVCVVLFAAAAAAIGSANSAPTNAAPAIAAAPAATPTPTPMPRWQRHALNKINRSTSCAGLARAFLVAADNTKHGRTAYLRSVSLSYANAAYQRERALDCH